MLSSGFSVANGVLNKTVQRGIRGFGSPCRPLIPTPIAALQVLFIYCTTRFFSGVRTTIPQPLSPLTPTPTLPPTPSPTLDNNVNSIMPPLLCETLHLIYHGLYQRCPSHPPKSNLLPNRDGVLVGSSLFCGLENPTSPHLHRREMMSRSMDIARHPPGSYMYGCEGLRLCMA